MKWESVLKFAIAAMFFLYSLNVMINTLRSKFD